MKLEDQVCSLELAKKLKELGAKQESLFWWQIDKTSIDITYGEWETAAPEKYSAFTVAELGKMLPFVVNGHDLEQKWCWRFGSNTGREEDRRWDVIYRGIIAFTADTEADARAKMLIYLLENKLAGTD